jgi:hypothetical protein
MVTPHGLDYLTIHKKLHDSRLVITITTFSTKTITMETTIQQKPPFLENRVPPPRIVRGTASLFSCTNRNQSYAIQIYQPCTTKKPNSSSCVLFRRRQFEFKLGYYITISHFGFTHDFDYY